MSQQVNGTLKNTPRGTAIQVSGGEIDRLMGRSVGQFEPLPDAVGKEVELNGQTYRIAKVGDSFKAGKVSQRYLYVEAGQTPAPVPVPVASGDPERWSQDRKDDEDYVGPITRGATAEEVRTAGPGTGGVITLARADQAPLVDAIAAVPYQNAGGRKHDEIVASLPGARVIRVAGSPYPASWVLSGGDLYLVRDKSGGDATALKQAPASPDVVAVFDRYAPAPAVPATPAAT